MATDVPLPVPPQEPASIWQRLRAQVHDLGVARTTPAQLGAAVGLGVLFACTPFYGLQLVLALTVAVPLRLNKIAVALGTQFSIPPMIPLIVFAGANMGELLLHQRMLPMRMAELRAIPVGELATRIGLAWTVGGFVLGAVLGVLVGGAVAFTVARVRKGRSTL